MFVFKTCTTIVLALWFTLAVAPVAAAQGEPSLWDTILKRIEISGLRHTKRELVIRELASKEGEPYLAENAARDPERLDKLGVFSSVKFNTVAEGDGVVLQIDVRETFPYLPILSVEITEKNGTAIGPGLKSVNLLGRAISMSAGARFGGQTVVELRAQPLCSWAQPCLTKVPALGVFIAYDSRDLISNAHQGWQNQFVLSKSGILGGGSDFWTYTIDVRRYEPLAARHTLALFSLASLRTGTVGEDMPVYLQFNLGGTNTVRGWTLGAREGKNQFINTLEYRYELMAPRSGSIFGFSGFLGLQLAAFGDLGSAWSDGDQFMPSFIGGYGFGLRAIIPFVNMVRLDFGSGEAGVGVKVAIGVMEKADMQRRRVR